MIASPLLFKWLRAWGEALCIPHPPFLGWPSIAHRHIAKLDQGTRRTPLSAAVQSLRAWRSLQDLSRQGLANDGSRRETTY